MSNNLLSRSIKWIIFAVLGLIVFHAPLTVYLGSRLPDFALVIKAWKEILIIVGLIILAVEMIRRRAWKMLTGDWLIRLIAVYAVIHIASLSIWNGTDAAIAGLMIDLRYLAFFALVYGFVKLEPQNLDKIVRLVILGAILVVGFGLLQVFLPKDFLVLLGYGKETIMPYTTVDQNHDFVRLQSTLRGPNPFGAYVAAAGALLAAFIVKSRKRMKWHWSVITGLVILLTCYLSYARSAYVALAVGLAIVLVVSLQNKLRHKDWFLLVSAALVCIIILFSFKTNPYVSTVFWHEDPSEGGLVNSNDGHASSLVDGMKRLATQPFGDGVGSTGSASLLGDQPVISENQYLMIAHEAGWAGLVVFLSIFVIVLKRLWSLRSSWPGLGLFASGVGLAIIGILLPVWVDDTVSIIWWGFSAAVIGGNYGQKIAIKKTARTT